MPAIGIGACADADSAGIMAPDMAVVVDDTDGANCSNLMAGQYTDAGDVCVTVDGDNVVVTYTTTGGWELEEAHLWIGEHLSDMPQTRKGNPKIGNFPYNSGDITGATSHQFSIPLSEWGLSASQTVCQDLSLNVAAHAALRKDNGDGSYQTETGWGDGTPLVDRGSWASAFSVTLKCMEDVTSGGGTETAFAFGGSAATCFLDIDEDGDGRRDFSRWGWSNGPIAEGTYSYGIYAGAGQCDWENKGTHVGTLTVVYSGGSANVTFDIDAPYYLTETHLYVGSDILARNVNGDFTVAPGQYPTIHDPVASGSSDSYTVGGLGGSVYVVAHATVGGF
jgi:hypothetical protein